jgi:hypothetical protein
VQRADIFCTATGNADVITAADVEDGGTPNDVPVGTDVQTDPDVPTGTDVVTGDDTPDVSVCPMGQIDCSGTCVDPTMNTANCGVCGRACGTGQMCVAGMCQCAMGQMFCNGACVDLQSDPANCGGCGTACMTGQRCTNGA